MNLLENSIKQNKDIAKKITSLSSLNFSNKAINIINNYDSNNTNNKEVLYSLIDINTNITNKSIMIQKHKDLLLNIKEVIY